MSEKQSEAEVSSTRVYSQKPAAVYMRRYLAELEAGTRVRKPRKGAVNTPVATAPQSSQEGLHREAGNDGN